MNNKPPNTNRFRAFFHTFGIYTFPAYCMVILVLAFAPGSKLLHAQDNTVTHTVKKGETLFRIAQKYEVSVDQIRRWNELKSDELQPGQLIRIRPGDSSDEAPSPAETEKKETDKSSSSYYIVKSGDSLYEIARKHDMSVSQLKALNNLTTNNIRVGQRLLVRQPTPTPSVAEKASGKAPQGQFTRYTVQEGEQWNDIIQKFKMDSVELAKLNPQTSPGELIPGRKLTVLDPPSITYKNPYRIDAQLQLISTISVSRYEEDQQGASTSSGELYNPKALTAAHPSLSLGSIIYVENTENRRGLFVKVNDRSEGKQLKLSERAYQLLHIMSTDSRVQIYQRP